MTERNKKEVGSCIIVDNKDRILVLLRGKTDPWKAGWWDLPGGHLDGDETPVEGATREAQEECGLTVRNLHKVISLPVDQIVKHFFVTRDYDGAVSIKPNPETGITEHDDYKWMSIEELSEIEKSIVSIPIIKRAMSLV